MSTLFFDGPARDKTLELRRAPRFLRVTEGPKGFDALDQLDDQPTPDEKLHAYVLYGAPMRGFIDGAKYSGPFIAATYRIVDPQPTDAEMRTTEAWREWTSKTATVDKSPLPGPKGNASQP